MVRVIASKELFDEEWVDPEVEEDKELPDGVPYEAHRQAFFELGDPDYVRVMTEPARTAKQFVMEGGIEIDTTLF